MGYIPVYRRTLVTRRVIKGKRTKAMIIIRPGIERMTPYLLLLIFIV